MWNGLFDSHWMIWCGTIYLISELRRYYSVHVPVLLCVNFLTVFLLYIMVYYSNLIYYRDVIVMM